MVKQDPPGNYVLAGTKMERSIIPEWLGPLPREQADLGSRPPHLERGGMGLNFLIPQTAVSSHHTEYLLALHLKLSQSAAETE